MKKHSLILVIPKGKFISAVLVMLLVLFSSPARAVFDPGEVDFSFEIGYLDYTWDYSDNSSRDTTVRKLEAAWLQSLSTRLRGGIQLAYLDLTQASNPVPAGLSTTGWGLGITLDGLLLDRKLLRLLARISFDYQSTRGISSNQNSDVSWSQVEGGLDLVFRPVSSLDFLVGADYSIINGKQSNSGNIDSLQTFENDEPTSLYAGLRINLGADGSIGLKGYGGGRTGIRLVFSRLF